jgi:hypothetical protein
VWLDEGNGLRRRRLRTVTVAELQAISSDDMFSLGFHRWDEKLRVIPLWAWHYIDPDAEVTCIDGTKVRRGEDNNDLDVRGGCVAYGFPSEEASEEARAA